MSDPIKVYMLPTPEAARMDTSNAINQIVLRLRKHLPAYGVELTEHQTEADLVVGHAGQMDPKLPLDCAHVHGLYPTALLPDSPNWHWGANRTVIESVRQARAVTVPSEWVADLFRRDMHLQPRIIGWGIDPAEWEPGPNQGYVLWNKSRAEGVCDPAPLVELAARKPAQKFVTTFGTGTPNILTIGRQNFAPMQSYIRQAGIYLATTKETFGIGTLEAMACGIPILGYRWGGTADLVEHGKTGFLAEPGDLDGLEKGLEYCLQHREILGQNARRVALQFTWDKVASYFAELYKMLLVPHTGPKVSVIIPCHNYAQYVGQAIDSVKAQQTTFAVEIIVVLDRCTDQSGDVVLNHLQNVSDCDVITADFGNPAGSRNAGIEAAHSDYICCLDADDMLGDTRFLQTCADALDADRSLSPVFTGLRVIDEAGQVGGQTSWPHGYDFEQQLQRHNQVPTCNLFRREAWERAGGYRRIYCPAEDAELWLRMGMYGYRGKQVTEEGWFHYRMHNNSLTTGIRTGAKQEPDWVLDKQWLQRERPFACGGMPPKWAWPVHNYDQPKVAFVVPCALHHRYYLPEALDSIEAQTVRDWECIVVDDAPEGSEDLVLPGYPWIRVVQGHGHGAGHARNLGVAAARAPLIAFLDADDTLSLRFLELTQKAFARTGRYVYTDWIGLSKAGQWEPHTTPEYDPDEVFRRTSLHSINILIPKAAILQVGGFDEGMAAWEDVEFFMRLAAAGLCGVRVPDRLVLYRYTTGNLRETGETIKPALLALLRQRFGKYIEGEKMCGCVEPKRKVGAIAGGNGNGNSQPEELIRIEYAGPTGQHNVIGVSKTNYGRRSGGDVFFVKVSDARADPEVFKPLEEVSLPAAKTIIPAPPERVVDVTEKAAEAV